MNVTADKLTPGVFGVCAGGGAVGTLIRDATGSRAGHAFGNLGGGLLVQGTPPVADTLPVSHYGDARWAFRMWDWLEAEKKWTPAQVRESQQLVTARWRQLVGTKYDYAAYTGFALEVLHLRSLEELSALYKHDPYRVCSALVYDGLITGKVPIEFEPEDCPSLVTRPDVRVTLPPNLVAPGMLEGLGERLEWF